MNAQEMSKSILTDIEKDKVIAFAKDEIMFSAVKKYVLAVAYKQGVIESGVEHNPNVNYALNLAWGSTSQGGMPRTDEELGQNLRALTHAVQLVGSGFKEIEDMKQPEVAEEKESSNPGE